MITHKDLSAYERAARIYCGRINLNPDDQVQMGGTIVAAQLNMRPRWMNVAEQMIHLSLMMVSMREAIGVEVVTPLQ